MFWPTMPDDVIDLVVDATANTRDTWWSKCVIVVCNVYVIIVINRMPQWT